MDDQQRHALDELQRRASDTALKTAGRAEGAALVVSHQITDLADKLGGRVAVLEDSRRTTDGDIKEIKADIGGIKRTLDALAERSTIQQALYALLALTWLAVGVYMLFDRFIGAGVR